MTDADTDLRSPRNPCAPTRAPTRALVRVGVVFLYRCFCVLYRYNAVQHVIPARVESGRRRAVCCHTRGFRAQQVQSHAG
jgi:hypothetical protein